MLRERKAAYIWTREHSPERLLSLDRMQRSWSVLFGEKEFGHYQPIQYLPFKHMNNSKTDFDAVLNGESTRVHLKVFTTREWFIREVYNKAHELTRARYPDYDAHHFVDGDRIGERRIVFHSERHALSRTHLRTALREIIKESEPQIKVNEFCYSTPHISSGMSEPALDYVVVRHLDEIDHNVIAQVADEIKTDGQPVLSDISVHFSWDDIESHFTELSEPELVYLNWEEAKPSLSKVDTTLIKAACNLDIDGIRQALADGANPNAIDYDDTVLSSVIIAWSNYASFPPPSKKTNLISLSDVKEIMRLLLDAGAHPDWYCPDGINALTESALEQQPELAELLLEYGADAAINLSVDMGIGAYPSAWNFAVIDGFNIDQELGAREVFYAMVRHRSSPSFTQLQEDTDRLDAILPDEQRSWRK